MLARGLCLLRDSTPPARRRLRALTLGGKLRDGLLFSMLFRHELLGFSQLEPAHYRRLRHRPRAGGKVWYRPTVAVRRKFLYVFKALRNGHSRNYAWGGSMLFPVTGGRASDRQVTTPKETYYHRYRNIRSLVCR